MSTHVPHLPHDLSLLQRRRLSWAVAKGSPLIKAAKRAGMEAPLASELAEKAEFPAMVFDQKYLLTGAQGVENYARVLEQVDGELAA